jgi:hypothetical protein
VEEESTRTVMAGLRGVRDMEVEALPKWPGSRGI